MLSMQRHKVILDLLDARGSISVADLVTQLAVSEMTVRRDLNQLERAGLLRRARGGALSARERSYEPPFLSRSAVHETEKGRIAQAAVSLVRNGDSLILDVGTTTLEIAHQLAGRRDLTVITPSFRAAACLAEQPGLRLIVTGGILRPGELSLVGKLTEEALAQFFVDKLFLGIAGISLEAGLTEFNLEDALVKKAMLHSAKETIVVADAAKFNRVAFAAVAPLTAAQRIITDASADADMVAALRARSIDVMLV